MIAEPPDLREWDDRIKSLIREFLPGAGIVVMRDEIEIDDRWWLRKEDGGWWLYGLDDDGNDEDLVGPLDFCDGLQWLIWWEAEYRVFERVTETVVSELFRS